MYGAYDDLRIKRKLRLRKRSNVEKKSTIGRVKIAAWEHAQNAMMMAMM